VFTDVRSGRIMHRPGLDSLLAYAREGDTPRPTRALARRIARDRGNAPVPRHRPAQLVEKINTASAAGELVFHVFGAIAHFERRLIAERTKDGIAAARARGGRGVNRSMPTRSRRR
jgi:DNA invertase Pin-like site-specific DNA recombinase